MANINDWKEVPVEDWQEVPINEVQTSSPSHTYNPLSTIKNFPGSVGKGLWGAVKAITSPIQTGSTLLEAGRGLGNKIERFAVSQSPVLGNAENYPVSPQEETFNALAKGFVQPYSSLKNFQTTAEEDPARIMFDLASTLTGTGWAAKAGQLPKIGNALTKAGAVTDPFYLMKESVMLPISKTNLPEKLYQSSLKGMTGKKWPWEKREAITATGLEEGIKGTPSGYVKLRDKIDSLNEQIGEVIEPAAAAGQTIPTKGVVDKFNKWATDYLNNSPHPREDSSIIDKVRMDITEQGNTINVGVAQSMKQRLYSELKERYGRLGSTAVEADKGYARAIKEMLADQYPELSTLNARDSSLLELEKAIEPAAKRIRNRDITGGAWMTFSPQAVFVRYLADVPGFKSALAIALHKARGLENINRGTTAIRQGLVETGQFTGLPDYIPQTGGF